ncbi:ATP-dependent helicase [Candidatus Acetothermia bacterium]|nr:ATP-dependent helicase [Candidatus Acetothermia bacterium]MCI2427426.1 ATP-dependent helicase [Candidatus Acetothermia bacterium]MCI2428702.1 ATP-dependent helicase [Candidatus Acetothermia bacterium]
MIDKLLQNLNEEQYEAVTFDQGPLLLVAGVGTGKTTVITRRIAYLIAEKKARPAEILALTFTEKAAAEMEERVDILVPYGYIDAQISTFHSFCDRLLRENALLISLTPDFRILTEPEQVIFFKDHLFDLPLKSLRPLGNPISNLRAILTLFSRAKDEDITPQEYRAYVEQLQKRIKTDSNDEALAAEFMLQDELADVYAKYQQLLLEKGFVDFGDLITLALRLLRDHPAILARYQRQFRYILVDEFQDTNYAQFELLKLLAGHHNLAVAGDDDQSIYKFRGAAISNILHFQRQFPDAKLIVLKINYRSTQEILDSSYRLIQNNNPDRLEVRSGIEKRLIAVSTDVKSINYRSFETLSDEADFVAEKIATIMKEKGCSYRDFAVLVRSNIQADPFLRAMNLRHIPWRFSGSRGLYDRWEIQTAISFLRLMADPRDNLSLHFLAGSPIYQLESEALALLTSYSRRTNKTLLQVFRIAAQTEGFLSISREEREKIKKIADDISAMMPTSRDETTGSLLYEYLMVRTEYLKSLSCSQKRDDLQAMQNLAKLFALIERFKEIAKYDRVPWFIDYLNALIEAGDNPAVGEADWDEDAVSLLTIHQAKGLEFTHVFLVGLVSGRFPSRHRRDPLSLPDELIKDILPTADFHQQEERRLFYVAMTRAKKSLYLTSALDYGGKRPRKPSLFICEAVDIPIATIKTAKRSPLATLKDHQIRPEKPLIDEHIISEAKRLNLSYRQIDDYLTCPLKYHYIHREKIPIRQHHTVIYGAAIHRAIRWYNINLLSQRHIPLEDLQKIFKQNWRAEGFLTREHEEMRFQEGLCALACFYEYQGKNSKIPHLVERRFSVIEKNNRIIGHFDRIDQSDEGGIIIDYKTSEIKDSAQADRRTKESRQLGIYALAYQRIFNQLPQRIELHFLTPQIIIGQFVPTEKRLEQILIDIEYVATGIRNGQFDPDPEYLACTYCAYRGICPYPYKDKE